MTIKVRRDHVRDDPDPSHGREIFTSRLVLPLCWDRLDHPPSAVMHEKAEQSNDDVLGFLLHRIDLEAMPRPADERLAEALAPLRSKLDMILGLLGRLSYRNVDLPPMRDVELGRGRIAWRVPRPLQNAEWLQIALYFHPTFRDPVVLFGKAASCVEQARDGSCRIEADLTEMPEAIAENLGRLAFLTERHQRTQRPLRTPAGMET
jgi:hypothetical protein